MKQCQPNPWQEFADTHKKDDKVSGSIKSITDFGIFVGLDGGIDGLIHLSAISWTESGEDAVKNYKKSDEVEALIISVDVEKERISLGIKQLTEDPNVGSVSTKTEETKEKKTAKKKTEKKEEVEGGTTNLGALLKAKLDDKND